jgi:hypothetical protein
VRFNVNLPIYQYDTQDIYYEATMTQSNNSVAVGISPIDTIASLLRVPFHGSERSAIRGGIGSGLQQNWTFFVLRSWPYDAAYTYHGDTGKVWHNQIGTVFDKPLKVNDVIGCGVDISRRCLFFTINGDKLEKNIDVDLKRMWFPIIALKGDGSELEVNFGRKPFVYQPSKISKSFTPTPETFLDEWIKQIDSISDNKDNLMYDHLKDITIVSKDGIKIRCHGIILSLRSEVIKVILEPPNNEGNIINIKDFDASTINKMLWFMYSDKIEEGEIDMELLGIANMYQIEALQIVCEGKLCSDLDVTNALDAWIGANLFERNKFMALCEEFIVPNWNEIQKTESFSRLMRKNAVGMANLMVKILNVKSNPNEM